MSGLGHSNMSGFYTGDSRPLFNPNNQMELQQYPRRSKPSISPTLGELLKRVEDAQSDTSTYSTPVHHHHQVLELGYACSSMPPSNPFVLSFNNLTYSVKVGPKMPFAVCGKADPSPGSSETASTKVLLNDISGEAREGEIMAVLGASGSGKSTLIDALADRIAKESLKGSVTLNGEVLESRLLKVISAYVMQDDLLFPMLTVEETLMFSAEFRLPRSLSRSKKKARVQALIDQLGLRNAANTVIGDEGHRGVSGGERRRVSIGIDIVHDPILLFLDEPTSGLDSTSAFMVVKVLQRIARSGSIVMLSVHQPSYRILTLLDRLIFLSHGQTVFGGSPGSLPEFFGQFGHPIPENENRTEFALDLIRELEESPDGTKTLVRVQQVMASHEQPHEQNPQCIQAFTQGRNKRQHFERQTGLRRPKQFKPDIFSSDFCQSTLDRNDGIILATVFYHLDNSPRGAQERLGFFAFAMSTTYYTCAESIPAFLQERYIFMRETAYNAYRRSSYVLAHSLISIPSLIVLSIAFAATTFWAVGLDGGFSGFLFFFFTILSAFWAGSSFVTFLSGVVSHVMLGFTVVVAILAYFLLFSGFFISRDRMPSFWLWFHYISLVKYPYEAALQNEFHDPAKCFVRGVQMFDTTPLAAVPLALKLKMLKSISSTLGMNITGNTCVVTGTDILRQQGITDISKWNCLWITIAWGFFFRILFYFALLLGSNNKRR
uniref:ABC transporter domain-containing protein n=2 Tax=Salix viminalis TaxID=40686 RepID=A0A6N2MDE3_SALVM